MKTSDPRFELIRRCIDEDASEAEHRELEGLLRDDPEFRTDYLSYLNLDSALGDLHLEPAEIAPVPAAEPRRVTLLRPLVSAAAGVMIGLIGASLAWAISLPENSEAEAEAEQELSTSVLEESFEDFSTHLADGFPVRQDVWGGDPSSLISTGTEHPSIDGDIVLKLESNPDTTLSYIQRIIEVDDLPQAGKDEVRTLKVDTSFLADTAGSRERYTIRLATFSESPEKIHKLWTRVPWHGLDGLTLTMTKVALNTQEDSTGWQTVSGTINIPNGTRSVVVSLAAGRFDPLAPKTPHYIDDIQANLLIETPVKRSKKKRSRKNRR